MTIKKAIVPIVFLFICLSAKCQSSINADLTGKEYEIINGSTKYLQVNSLISLDSVLKVVSQQKLNTLANEPVIFFGYNPYYYWYKFSIANNDSISRNLILLLGGLGIRKAEIWQINNAAKLAGSGGYQYPFDERPYRFVHHSFSLSLAANTTDTFYVKVDESHAYKSTSFVLVTPKAMQKFEHRFYMLTGIMIGLLLLFFLFNLYLYFSIKEKIHVWYGLYIVTMLFFIIKQEGIDAEYLGLDSATGYRATCMAAIASFGMGCMLQVCILFLVNVQRTSLAGKILSLLKWASFLLAAVQVIIFYVRPANQIEAITFQIANKTTLITFASIVFACLYSFLKGFKPAAFILAGQLVFIVGGITRSLFIASISYIFPPSLFEIGLVLEVVIISFGLMYRYNQYKNEKEEITFQLQQEKLNTTKAILLAQEEEKKRIAADLHDELGGNLAAIKMTLQSFNVPSHQADSLNYLIDKASANARHIAHNLMPPEFENTSLKAILGNLFQLVNTEGKIKFHFFYTGSSHHFTKQEDLIIYRVIMELTSNIIRHANATEATMQLVYHENYLAIMAEDNGGGFGNKNTAGIGLKTIRLRIDFLNGTFDIDTGNTGTTIMIQIPYKEME